MIRRFFLEGFLSLLLTLGGAVSAPIEAQQQSATKVERPLARRRAPDGQARKAMAFVRTELFFGTAKPNGAVTDEEFAIFVDEVVTPLFPDGLTVLKADGQFRGADGVTIKERSFVLVLLYPVESQKAGSRHIDTIRATYLDRHDQESVLRVDDPYLVWVSF